MESTDTIAESINVKTYYCSNCSTLLIGTEKFCPHCGKKLGKKDLDTEEVFFICFMYLILLISLHWVGNVWLIIICIVLPPVLSKIVVYEINKTRIYPKKRSNNEINREKEKIICNNYYKDIKVSCQECGIDFNSLYNILYTKGIDNPLVLSNVHAHIVLLCGILPLVSRGKTKFTKVDVENSLIYYRVFQESSLDKDSFIEGFNELVYSNIIYRVNQVSYVVDDCLLNDKLLYHF